MYSITKQFSVILLLAALLPVTATAGAYSGIIAFGDSLTDTGNKYVDTGLSNTPPYDLLDAMRVPDGPYTRGGLHHSNGATWIEVFARPLGLGDAVRPALRNPGVATNYAYGGARARAGSPEPDLVPGCLDPNSNLHFPGQVMKFLADFNYSVPADALYVVFVGGNDIVDAVKALGCDQTGVTSVGIVGAALSSVSDNIAALYMAGARKFLVLNTPDLGLTPAFNLPLNDIPQASGFGRCFSLLFNFGTLPGSPVPPACMFPPGIPGLADVVAGLQSSPLLPGIEIATVDVYSKYVQLVNAPLDTEPQNATDTCVVPNIPPYACRDPDDHVFWDGVHPTSATHSIIAALVAAVLAD